MYDAENAKRFYDKEYSQSEYANAGTAEKHDTYEKLQTFINRYQLHNKRCLEIGCGRGIFQELVEDYTGVDLSDTVHTYLHKPFYRCSSATQLPFADNEFDAIWTIYVLEHVPEPEKALMEMRRVLRPGGLLFLKPAWQCRPWATSGFSVRPYKDFDLKGKLIKASIPVRNSILFRSLYIFPRRLVRCLVYAWGKSRTKFRYKLLNPNYDHYWQPDSDALNSMDPYEAILWFMSRGDTCLSYGKWFSSFFIRTGDMIFRIRK
jgi:SAM-dependent methyltransferase